MNFIQKISQKTGLTQTEVKVISFLIVVFLVGLTVKSLNLSATEPTKKKFNYSASDSIFYSVKTIRDKITVNKPFDSKQESSDFNKSNLNEDIKKQLPRAGSININTAGLEQLIMLPGVGNKTAKNILTYRNMIGRFKNTDQLLEVDGIGESKLEKIKKYVFIR